jgi:hypothetical protein
MLVEIVDFQSRENSWIAPQSRSYVEITIDAKSRYSQGDTIQMNRSN